MFSRWKVESTDLPEGAIADFTAVIKLRSGIRSLEYAARSVIRKYDLPGLVVLWMFRRGRWFSTEGLLPPPFASAFEPVRLDLRDPRVIALYKRQPLQETRISPDRLTDDLAGNLILGLWVVGMLVAAYKLGCHWFDNSGARWLGPIAMIALLIWFFRLHRWFEPPWLIGPGWVKVDRFSFLRRQFEMRRYTVSDTVLVIEPGRVTLCGNGARVTRCLSDVEREIVLAAWRCPVS